MGWLASTFHHGFSDVYQGCSWGQPTQLQHHISVVDVSTANAAAIAQGVRREPSQTNSKDGVDLMRKTVVGDAEVWRQRP